MAVLAVIEPHVAGPVVLALFLGVKASRATLAAAGVVLAAVSLAFGPALTIEYFTRALPAHGLAEVGASDQFSVTWIAHVLGAGDVAALRAGVISYAVTTALGIVAGVRLAQRFARPAFVVLVPAAFAVIGGTFIHDIQLPIAIPAALLLASVTTGRVRALALAAVVGLALTWYDDFGAVLALAALAVLAWTAPLTFDSRWRRAALAASACAGYACIILVFHKLSPNVHVALPPHPDVGGPPGELASEVWGRFVRATAYGWTSLRTFAEKLPLWLALASLACAVLRAAWPPTALTREPTSPPSR